MQHQYPYIPNQIASLEKSISSARISTYQRISGGDRVKALELYYWNMALGQSLYVPLQTLEVSLRNAIAGAIEHIFGQTWYVQARFKVILSSWSRTTLESTVRNVTANNRRRGKPVSAGDIVANLTFSFWRELLKQRYDVHLWNSQLANAFPNLPARRGNQDIYSRVNKIISLRNRIAHYEPIIASRLTPLYSSMLEVIEWICSDTRDWVEHHCDFDTVYNSRP